MILRKTLVALSALAMLSACNSEPANTEDDTAVETTQDDTQDKVEDIEEDDDTEYKTVSGEIPYSDYIDMVMDEMGPSVERIGRVVYQPQDDGTDVFVIDLDDESKERFITALEYLVEYDIKEDFGDENVALLREAQLDFIDEIMGELAVIAHKYTEESIVGVLNPITRDEVLTYAINGENRYTMLDFLDEAIEAARIELVE